MFCWKPRNKKVAGDTRTRMALREPLRVAVIGSLLASAVIIASCPCQVLGECKQRVFYATALLPVVAVAAVNLLGVE